MLGANVLTDLQASSLPSSLTTATPWGSETILKHLETPKTSIADLKRVQLPLLALRHSNSAPQLALLQSELSKQIAPHCAILDESCKNQYSDIRIQESVGQILWDPKSYLAKLNTHPRLITGLLNWKTLLVPFFSVIMPILAIIVPFFLIRFLHGEDAITMDGYISHVKQTVLRQITIPAILRAKNDGDIFGKVTETIILLLTIGTFCMGLWNQIQSAFHLRTIASDLTDRGNSLQKIVESSRRIINILNTLPSNQKKGLAACIKCGEQSLAPLANFSGGLAGFGQTWNTPILFEPLKAWIGMLDAQITIASAPNICFPKFKEGAKLFIQGIYHPCINSENVILNNADFSIKSHVLLTGPNRGGKSTFCKSLGLSILYAQTWGIAWAKSMTLEPFQKFETALSPTDILGKMSLFESEIEFAKHVLTESETNQNVFVMMDEIFHSTNAHDGIAASRIFLKRLYNCQNTVTLISTHYRELVTDFASLIQPWQMMATENTNKTLSYTYQCKTGVSDKSSVMEILKERGLAA